MYFWNHSRVRIFLEISLFAQHPNLLKSYLHCYFWEILIYHYFIIFILFLLCICIDVAIYLCKYKVWIENVKTQKLFSDPCQDPPTKIYLTACQALHHRVANQNALSQFDLLHASLSAGKISLCDTVIYMRLQTHVSFLWLCSSAMRKTVPSKKPTSPRDPVRTDTQYLLPINIRVTMPLLGLWELVRATAAAASPIWYYISALCHHVRAHQRESKPWRLVPAGHKEPPASL